MAQKVIVVELGYGDVSRFGFHTDETCREVNYAVREDSAYFQVSVRSIASWPAPSPMRNVPTRCRDEPHAPSSKRPHPRQTSRERPGERRRLTALVCLGARSRAPRQTTLQRRFVGVMPSRRTSPWLSPMTSTSLLCRRRKFVALVKPPARPPQKPCSPLHP
jgi:hypothetical protein